MVSLPIFIQPMDIFLWSFLNSSKIWKQTKRETTLYQTGRKWGEKGKKDEGGVCEGQDMPQKFLDGPKNIRLFLQRDFEEKINKLES